MTRLSPTGLIVKGSLLTYLGPRLAMDAAKIDLNGILSTVTASNFRDRKPQIASAVRRATRGRLAQDADLDDLPELLNAVQSNNLEDKSLTQKPAR